jgi:hypothetical protein
LHRALERSAVADDQSATRDRLNAPADLLRAALDKIVFFEWRVAELGAELAKAHERAAAAEADRAREAEARGAAEEQARAARTRAQALESERARLAALLAAPRPFSDASALRAERDRAARLEAELADARAELSRQQDERGRWIEEMLAQARNGGDEPAALASFISELRAEVIELRASGGDLRARGNGTERTRGASVAQEPPDALERARDLAAEGRLSSTDDVELATRTALAQLGASSDGAAARALGEQALRGLASADPERRMQSARHLAAVPVAAAAPLLAAALSRERDAKAKAALAPALVACGGEGAADIVAALQSEPEHPLVRLAALDALYSAGGGRRSEALRTAVRDRAAAVRRRAAALAYESGASEILGLLSRDSDASVRAAADVREPDPPVAAVPPEPPRPARDPEGEALGAVQAAIFGLTDAELARHLDVDDAAAHDLAESLVRSGRLARRGKRLVVAAPLAAAEGGT